MRIKAGKLACALALAGAFSFLARRYPATVTGCLGMARDRGLSPLSKLSSADADCVRVGTRSAPGVVMVISLESSALMFSLTRP